MTNIYVFFVGLLFGLGLLISGMVDPGKVIGFLDIFGLWDPSLLLVMLGAIFVAFFGFRCKAKDLKKSSSVIDKPLIVGSLMFGVGWGLVGFCPGPALVVMAALNFKGLIFSLFMLLGMAFFILFNKYKK